MWNVTPWSSWIAWNTAPTSGPRIRSNGRPNTSTTSTGAPIDRSEAATSIPMNPAPTIATRPPAAAASRMRSQSSMVRSWKMPSRSLPGSVRVRFRPPVASSRRSNPIVSPPARPTVLAAGSSDSARVPGRSSTSCSPYQSAGGRKNSPALVSPRR